MPQFFVSPNKISGNAFALDSEESHHAAHVFRLSKGDDINLFDGSGGTFSAEITGVYNGIVEGRIKSSRICSYELEIALFAPLIKPDRFDWLVEKAAETGVNRIIPIITSRSEVKSQNKVERWKKIILAAAKQSMSPVLCSISEPVQFNDAVKTKSAGLYNIIYLCGTDGSKFIKKQKNIGLWIGPEGGFTEAEAQFALKNGFSKGSLGLNILRAETASVAAAALLRCKN